MPFSIDNEQGRSVLNLEGPVTIQQAHDLAAEFEKLIEDGAPIHVGTKGLKDIDTCILQLLYSLRKTAAEFSIDNPSELFIAAVDRCGLRRELLSVREAL
jgi:anti-anti-sigma regulatory factor